MTQQQPPELPPELTVSWGAKAPVRVAVTPEDTVGSLKRKLEGLTTVSHKRLKLLGLGAKASDEQLLSQVYKPRSKLMMVGTPEAVSALVAEAEAAAPAGQLDEEGPADDPAALLELKLKDRPENLHARQTRPGWTRQEKLARRISSVKLTLQNPPRPGKKCLVLDIDYTIFDLSSSAERPEELARPHLHQFLAAAYADYDLVIWSATSMKWIEVKMRELGCASHPDYKLCCYLDSRSMVTVYEEEGRGVFDCKPLPLLWAKVEAFNADNTIMFDDLRRNYVFNLQNGLVIKPYRKAHSNKHTDRELLRLGRYLKIIAKRPSLSDLNHDEWKDFLRKHEDRSAA